MMFQGEVRCPNCDHNLERMLRDVLRKADDVSASHVECYMCDAPLVVSAAIVHHVTIVLDNQDQK